jgi:hypothetical protein
VRLGESKTDAHGMPVREECVASKLAEGNQANNRTGPGRRLTVVAENQSNVILPATDPSVDYPAAMSQFERESLAAEAKLAEERRARKRAKRQPANERRVVEKSRLH